MRCWIAGFLLLCGQSLGDAQERLARYGVSFLDNQPLTPIVIYDTHCRRIIHKRLYTVTELPRIQEYGRFDDYTVVWVEQTAFRKKAIRNRLWPLANRKRTDA